jgi:hypothetical protein
VLVDGALALASTQDTSFILDARYSTDFGLSLKTTITQTSTTEPKYAILSGFSNQIDDYKSIGGYSTVLKIEGNASYFISGFTLDGTVVSTDKTSLAENIIAGPQDTLAYEGRLAYSSDFGATASASYKLTDASQYIATGVCKTTSAGEIESCAGDTIQGSSSTSTISLSLRYSPIEWLYGDISYLMSDTGFTLKNPEYTDDFMQKTTDYYEKLSITLGSQYTF